MMEWRRSQWSVDSEFIATRLPALVAPSVSIVICNHNYARFLPEAIESALAQTLRCQVIVVDDGSTDGSIEVLARVSPRVDVLLQTHSGQLAAYNRGFARCRGDIVIFLDADDALMPHAAQVVAACFGEGVAKVHYRMEIADESGHEVGNTVPGTLASGDMLTPLRRHGLLYPSPPGSGNAYRHSVLDQLLPLPLDPADWVGADFFTIYGSVAYGRVAACDLSLARYRLHKKAKSQDESLVFGNAALGNEEAAKVVKRYARLGRWVEQRTSHEVIYPEQFLDFSVQKSSYAQKVFGTPYLEALKGCGQDLRDLLKALWLQREYGLNKRFGLSLWAVLVLIAPRRAAFRLARYVCNPLSRVA